MCKKKKKNITQESILLVYIIIIYRTFETLIETYILINVLYVFRGGVFYIMGIANIRPKVLIENKFQEDNFSKLWH